MTAHMKLADPVELARRMALWTVRTAGARVALRSGFTGAKERLESLPEDSDVSEIVAKAKWLRGIVGAPDMIRAADEVIHVANLANATYNRWSAIDTVYAAHGSGSHHLFGDGLVEAWVGAGGEIEPLRRPGINQLLVRNADEHGLDMSGWHCGTAHCIAGWYSALSGQPNLEGLFSCRFAAWLVFAVNNPGESLPYMGSNQDAGEHELLRLNNLNPVTSPSEEKQ